MLATEWAASKLVAILPQWRPSNETGMNVKSGWYSCMPAQSSERENVKVQPVIPFLYHAGSDGPTNNHQDEKLVMVCTDF